MSGVKLKDGQLIAADVVVMAVGIRPAVVLTEAASFGTADRVQSAHLANDSKPGGRMTMATIGSVGSEDSRFMGAAFRRIAGTVST